MEYKGEWLPVRVKPFTWPLTTVYEYIRSYSTRSLLPTPLAFVALFID